MIEDSINRKGGGEAVATYVNFYIANGGVVVPAFGEDTDDLAVETLRKVIPERKVVQIRGGREIILGGGNVHCITQQQPAG